VKPEELDSVVSAALGSGARTLRKPRLWDGRAAERAVQALRVRALGR
jgi:hypothetical protein